MSGLYCFLGGLATLNIRSVFRGSRLRGDVRTGLSTADLIGLEGPTMPEHQDLRETRSLSSVNQAGDLDTEASNGRAKATGRHALVWM